jgi:hypothetical protein
MRFVLCTGGIFLLVLAAVVLALLLPIPAATPSTPPLAQTATPTPTPTSTWGLIEDLDTAGLPLLSTKATVTEYQRETYTEAAVAKAPCTVAAEGGSWSIILSLDEELPVGPTQYGQMVAIGIRDECPRYLAVVPPDWLPSPTS